MKRIFAAMNSHITSCYSFLSITTDTLMLWHGLQRIQDLRKRRLICNQMISSNELCYLHKESFREGQLCYLRGLLTLELGDSKYDDLCESLMVLASRSTALHPETFCALFQRVFLDTVVPPCRKEEKASDISDDRNPADDLRNKEAELYDRLQRAMESEPFLATTIPRAAIKQERSKKSQFRQFNDLLFGAPNKVRYDEDSTYRTF
jgi:hypothetical protein